MVLQGPAPNCIPPEARTPVREAVGRIESPGTGGLIRGQFGQEYVSNSDGN